ncbi:hypothetical protein MATR_07850 [Marivirga tractuosa]|uniref:Uncharacterized protein n=1 Tax=Marivirga tractuosa (strain ATCC 23168 / DSM 4126 / NBRC 15989 / NCIMB 1408 / VKM B-1430 / H-43) TaxID=643867 RepID=E4TQ38_MARTH|nr:hypothetical protein Ftrac_1595 [Marivirga tractuosa DSM 4126]BDD13960.1 hypothetical protein MATR_07850 [Marivirga tractuosa]
MYKISEMSAPITLWFVKKQTMANRAGINKKRGLKILFYVYLYNTEMFYPISIFTSAEVG